MKKKNLTKEQIEFKKTCINSTLGDLAQEGFNDEDGFTRKLLEDEEFNGLTEKEAIKRIITETKKRFKK